MAFLIRAEQPVDQPSVRRVNESAFGHKDEADLVDALRQEGAVLLSLVADVQGEIAGHILFSRMTVESPHGSIAAVSLAPMAVLPDYQRQNIGSELVRQGLTELRVRGERIVIVLGHKNYYPRFGFTPENARNLIHPFPPDAYMAVELSIGALRGVHGAVRYPAAFGL